MRRAFAHRILVDCEFHAPAGERPSPICVSALDIDTGVMTRAWLRNGAPSEPPFPVDRDTLVVAFFASAEVSCFLALGWPVPANILCLHAEHRALSNGRLPEGLDRRRSLLDVLQFWEVPAAVSSDHKDAMRALCIRGGPFGADEARAIQSYCDSDVVVLRPLLARMLAAGLDLDAALLRGRYIACVAQMERRGVPIDTDAHDLLCRRWDDVRWRVAYDAAFGYERVYDGTCFVRERYERYLARRRIAWPRLPSGELEMTDEVWSDMARIHPQLAGLHEARKTLAITSMLRMDHDGVVRPRFRIGRDSRNRAIIGPFASKTSRNQPRTSEFVIASAAWIRGGLIRPQPGRALAYIDMTSAEIGIAAALSRDASLTAAYASGDAHMHFAQLAGHAPAGATTRDPVTREPTKWEAVRSRFKVVFLATSYGMSAKSLGESLGIQTAYAQELLDLHRATFPDYWRWSDSVSATAHGLRELRTRQGWTLHVTRWSDSDRSLRNFPVQSTCADILRTAAILAEAAGVEVLAPLHDAFLIEAPKDQIDDAVERMRAAMRRASEIVLGGFALGTDVHGPIHYPNRLEVTPTWTDVMSVLGAQP